jgi:hypothetical protein
MSGNIAKSVAELHSMYIIHVKNNNKIIKTMYTNYNIRVPTELKN